MSSLRETMPESGNPLAMPFAMTMMSGRTSGQCSMALRTYTSGGNESGHDLQSRTDAEQVQRRAPDAQVLASATKASLDFVDDEKDAVLVANAAQALKVALRRGDVATLAKDRLDDERSRVTRCSLLLEEELELVANKAGGTGSGFERRGYALK
mgnify:CR=1 FL=1